MKKIIKTIQKTIQKRLVENNMMLLPTGMLPK